MRRPHDVLFCSVKWVHAKKSSRIHWFLRSISLSSSSPPLSALPVSFSIMVTCKDTCGVTDIVRSGWITSPEIDQPFCTSLHHHYYVQIFLLYCFSLQSPSMSRFCSRIRWIRPMQGEIVQNDGFVSKVIAILCLPRIKCSIASLCGQYKEG